MTKGEALSVIAEEAVAGRNYYTCDNFHDQAEIDRLAEALRALECLIKVDEDGSIKVVAFGEEFE